MIALTPKRKMVLCEIRSSTCIQFMKSMNPNKMTLHRSGARKKKNNIRRIDEAHSSAWWMQYAATLIQQSTARHTKTKNKLVRMQPTSPPKRVYLNKFFSRISATTATHCCLARTMCNASACRSAREREKQTIEKYSPLVLYVAREVTGLHATGHPNVKRNLIKKKQRLATSRMCLYCKATTRHKS